MSYDSIELSAFESSPIELFTFVRGNETWRFTDADADIGLLSGTYTAIPISRSSIEHTVDMSRNPITITLGHTNPMLEPFKSAPPTDITLVTINKIHAGSDAILVTWLGRVTNVKFTENEAELSCEPTFTSLKRAALRRRYQTSCPHVLYSTPCGALRVNYECNTTILTSIGLVVTSADFGTHPDGHFSGGFIEVDVNGIIFRRDISNHVGTDLTLNLPLPANIGRPIVKAYPGCDHSLATCHTKFVNEVNFGGQPFYRSKNPMNGTQIF